MHAEYSRVFQGIPGLSAWKKAAVQTTAMKTDGKAFKEPMRISGRSKPVRDRRD
jgi:hypothetical protein